MTTSTWKLYCESLDRFVLIRVFSPEEALELLRSVPAGSKKEYSRFIVRAAISGFDEDIAGLIAQPACNEILADVIVQELYSLSIRVNPSLEVRTIEIPGTADQVRRFCESLDRWVVVKRLSESEVAELSPLLAKLPPQEAKEKVLDVVYADLMRGLDRRGVEPAYDVELDLNELLSIGARVNPTLGIERLMDVSSVNGQGALDIPGMPRGSSMERLLWVMDRLRDPSKGCPWDLQQSHESLKPYLVEETHEVLEAIDADDPARLEEELGDVLLQIVFHARLAKENDRFDFDRIAAGITRKLIQRHPHVFGNAVADSPEEVIRNWESIKKYEKKKDSVVDGIPQTLPTLLKAFRLQEKASVIAPEGASTDRLGEEVSNWASRFASAVKESESSKMAETLGDLLFSIVNLGRLLNLNAEFCLEQANARFVGRYKRLEAEAKATQQTLKKMSLDEITRATADPTAPAFKDENQGA